MVLFVFFFSHIPSTYVIKSMHTHLHLSSPSCSFTEAVSQRPDSGELYFLLGQLYWNMGEDTRRDKSKVHTHLLKVISLLLCPFFALGHWYLNSLALKEQIFWTQ